MDLPNPISCIPNSGGRAWFLGLLIVAAGSVMLSQSAFAQYREYEVKAAFLANFAQFAKWPDAVFSDANAPFVIGVLGDDPFGGALESVVKGQAVSGRKVVVRRGRRPEDFRNCQIVFIGKSERARIADIVGSFQMSSILTVGETEQFVKHGGMVGFLMEGDKVRFEINNGAARRAGLELSSRLVKLARATP